MNIRPHQEGVVEHQEGLNYRTTIVVHRHGEKASLAGDLTERGKEETGDYFGQAYEGVTLDLPDGVGVGVEYSPIDRTKETAKLAVENTRVEVTSFKPEERLSEGQIAHHEELINKFGGRGGKWIPAWIDLEERPLPDVKTGREVVRDFTNWLLEKIENGKTKGGANEIDAFSHAPVMMAFMLTLEKYLSIHILPLDWNNDENSVVPVRYLESFNFYHDSKSPTEVLFSFRGQKVNIPLDILREMAK